MYVPPGFAQTEPKLKVEGFECDTGSDLTSRGGTVHLAKLEGVMDKNYVSI